MRSSMNALTRSWYSRPRSVMAKSMPAKLALFEFALDALESLRDLLERHLVAAAEAAPGRLDEHRADGRRQHADEPDPGEHHERGHQLAAGGRGHYVAVAHGGHRLHGPPQPTAGVREV